jgi:beta-glucosidase
MMKSMKIFLFGCLLILSTVLILTEVSAQDVPNNPISAFKNFPKGSVYQNTALSPEVRAKDVIKYMNYDEMLALVGGWNNFFFPGIERLGLRPVHMADASQGIRMNIGFVKGDLSTSYPGTVALASTWNINLSNLMGKSLGSECRSYGVDILLGPGINMQRFSVSGRNFEYMGEDPILTSKMIVPYIIGMQSNQVLATAKHFIGNDQEFCRHFASSDIDERTLREIYLRPWQAVIQKAGVKAIMTGNNGVNGTPLSMDKPLVNDVLRDEYGFTGIVMTDWQNSGYFPSLQYLFPESGVSLLMPVNTTFANYAKTFIGMYPSKKAEMQKALEKKVYQNLLPLFQMGVYDRVMRDYSKPVNVEAHKEVARKIAEEAICLLKNEGNLLPLSTKQNVLLMGKEELFSGEGSGYVIGYDQVNFAAGLQKVFGSKLIVNENPSDQEIKTASAIIYRLSKNGGEGHDIPFEVGLDENISRVAALNPNVIVVVSACNGMPMPWLNNVRAVLWSFFLGQERGNALANVITGKVNPSAKLPFTLEKNFSDSQNPFFNYIGDQPYWEGDNKAYKEYWNGRKQTNVSPQFAKYIKPNEVIRNAYTEGIFIGYRWYDKQNKEVHFPFGYGLSYTQFDFSNCMLSKNTIQPNDSIKVSVQIKNVGKTSGAEIVQLYIADTECSVERPVKELKHFDKVFLKASETKVVEFTVKTEDLTFWDVIEHKWKVEPGTFNVMIGASSRDIRLNETFNFAN